MMRLGTLNVTRSRICVPTIGAWLVDLDIDLAHDEPTPSGPQTLTLGTATLKGTVLPQGTGRFGEYVRVRMLAGAAAWATLVPALHWHNDAGVSSAVVTQATASAVGEISSDPNPLNYGPDFERVGDPRFGGMALASNVLEGRAWYVDANGITQLASWPTVQLGTDANVLEYDPTERIATLSADEVVWPGTQLADVRFGTLVVCETDQTFTQDGSRVIAYCAPALTDRVGQAMQAVSTAVDPVFDRVYWYRISTQGADGRLTLQAVSTASGIPSTLPISIYMGVPGASAKFALGGGYGSYVAVLFLNGDRTQPRVVSFDGTSPLELVLDATTIKLGKNASSFVALASNVQAELVKISAALTAVANGGGVLTGANPYTVPGNVAATKTEAE